MNCLKCGKDTSFENIFCDNCLKEMEHYPIPKDIPVVLPKRTVNPTPKKATRKKTVSLEDQIVVLKNRIRMLSILLTAVSILAALLIYPAVKYLMEDHFRPGQNYTSIVSKTSATDSAESN